MNNDSSKESFLEKAAYDYRCEPHQVAAWRTLEASVSSQRLSAFKRRYSGFEKPHRVFLDVPYFRQKKRQSGHSEKLSFSYSMAMAMDHLDPYAIDGDVDWYLQIVSYYGDSVSIAAQVSASRSIGFDTLFADDGREADLIMHLDKQIPVPIGILHRGPIDDCTGGGHWICLVGYDDKYFYAHDPLGDLDLVTGVYDTSGKNSGEFVKYDRENLLARWNINTNNDGWYMQFGYAI